MQKTLSNETAVPSGAVNIKQLATLAARDLRANLRDHGKKLRRNQKTGLQAFAQRLAQGVTGDYVKRPTGAGKTGILGFFIKSMQGLLAETLLPQHFTPNVLFIAPTSQLLEQIAEELASPLIGFDPDEITIYNSLIHTKPEDDFSWLDAPILGMTLAAYRSLWRDGFIDPVDRPFVILDEMDLARGPATDPAIKALHKNCIVLGATATDRFIHNGREITLGDYYFDGRPPCSGMTFRDGVNEKVLCPTKNIIFRINHTKAKPIDVQVDEENELTPTTRHAIITQEGRDEAAIRAIASYEDLETGTVLRDEKQIWYCDGIDHAETITKRLNEIYGEDYAVTVSGKMTRRQQRKILTDYRRGKYRAVVNADLLLRGFNDPEASVCVMLRQSRSGPLVEQAGGRVTRRNKRNKNKIAYVINFMDSTVHNAGFAYYGRVVGGMFIAPIGYRPVFKKSEQNFVPEFGAVPAAASAIAVKDIEAEFDAERSLDFGFDNLADLSNFIPKSFLTREQMVERLGERYYYDIERLYEAFQTRYRELRTSKDQSKKVTIKWLKSDISLPLDTMRLCRYQGRPTFVIHERFVTQFEEALKRVSGKTDELQSTSDYFKSKSHRSAATVYAVYAAVERAWQDAMEQCAHKPSFDQCFFFSHKGQRYRLYLSEAGHFKDEGGRVPFCIHSKALERFMPEIILRKRPASMWTKSEFERQLRVGFAQVEPHLESMRAYYERLKLEERSDSTKCFTITIGTTAITIPATDMGLYGGGRHGETFCTNKKYVTEFEKALSTLRVDDNDYVILQDMQKLFGSDRGRARTIFKQMRTAWQSSKGKPFQISLDDAAVSFDEGDCRMVLGRKGAKNFAIRRKFISVIRNYVDGTPTPPDDTWVLIDKMAELTGLNYNTVRKIYLHTRNAMAMATETEPNKKFYSLHYQDRCILIPVSGVAVYKEPRPKGSISLHMSNSIASILKEAFPPRAKTTANDFDYKSMSDTVRIKRESMIEAYNTIRAAWLDHHSARAADVAQGQNPDANHPNTVISVTFGSKVFRFDYTAIGEKLNDNDRIIFSVDKTYAKDIVEIIGLMRGRTPRAMASLQAG